LHRRFFSSFFLFPPLFPSFFLLFPLFSFPLFSSFFLFFPLFFLFFFIIFSFFFLFLESKSDWMEASVIITLFFLCFYPLSLGWTTS